MNQIIKVGFCVAYDWSLLQNSLPLIYEYSDKICISLDKDRISWTGNPFEFDEEGFKNLIQSIDVDNKIEIYEDDFHIPELGPMRNEVRQREMMAEYLGKNDGWHLQLDSDEYFLNFKGFVKYLNGLKTNRPINVCCPLIILYKRINEGFLIVDPSEFSKVEFIQIASQTPHFEHGRRNGFFNHYTDFCILHQSWARTKEEVWQKLNNWGHRDDTDIQEYFNVWDKADITNYTEYKNFNKIAPEAWPSLALLPLSSNQTVTDLIDIKISLPIKKSDLLYKNSILLSYIHKLIKIIFK